MQKHNYFIYLIFILFSSLFISACQDTQEEIEDEVEEETEISCFATRINYYSETGELTRYTNRGYTSDKKILFDSTFNASDNSIRTVDTYTYTGNNHTVKNFRQQNGQLILGSEQFYEQDKLVKNRFYNLDGNLQGETIYLFTGGLSTRSESYDNNGVLTGVRITEYNGQLMTKSSSYDGNNNLLGLIKYEYQQNNLEKEELYDANEELTKYYITTIQNNTNTRQAYDAQGNILPEKRIYTKDANDYTIYFLSQTTADDYQESNYTITYNEYGYPILFISEITRFSGGSIFSQSYTKREDLDVQCY